MIDGSALEHAPPDLGAFFDRDVLLDRSFIL